MADHVGCVDHCALWTLDFDCLADDEGCHVFRNVTGGVGLDEEVEVAGLVVAGDGGVGADDFFGRAVGLGEVGCDRDVLTDWKAEDGVLGWEGESVPVRGLARGLLGE